MGIRERFATLYKASMDSRKFAKYLLTRSLPKDQWTTCYVFRCVMNTGWAAGHDKYKCRIGKDCHSCGAIKRTKKPITVEL